MESDGIERYLKALAHPVRRAIIKALAEKKKLSYTELMRITGVEDSGTFAFHIKVLQGLIEKDSETGDYMLTEDGWKAYRVLEIIGGGELEAKEEAISKETKPGGEVVVISDTMSFTLTKNFAERLKREGKRLLIEDVLVVTIEDMPEELLDSILEGMHDVLTVKAPKHLIPVITLKSHDVTFIGGGTGYVSGIIGDVVRGVVKAMRQSIPHYTGERIHVERRERIESTPYSLSVSIDSSTVKLSHSSSDELLISGEFYDADDLEISRDRDWIGIDIDCGECRIEAPTGIDSLKLKISSSSVHGKLESIRDAVLDIDSSSTDLEFLRMSLSRIVASIDSSATRINIDYTSYTGESIIDIDLDTSTLRMEITVPENTRLDIEAYGGYNIIEINGSTVYSYRDKDYDEAESKLKIRVRNDSSTARIRINKKRVEAIKTSKVNK